MKKLLLALVVMFSVGTVMAQSKVAHVNSQKLLDTLPSRKVAITKLQDFEASGVKELQEMEADFNAALA
jgi:Skp family chaperone for outer membrane proteins